MRGSEWMRIFEWRFRGRHDRRSFWHGRVGEESACQGGIWLFLRMLVGCCDGVVGCKFLNTCLHRKSVLL